MVTISSVASQQSILSKQEQFTQAIDKSVFESLLSSFDSRKAKPSNALLEFSASLIDALEQFDVPDFADAVDFPFSNAFVSTFGTSGPLPIYIAGVSAQLKLDTTQQLALQDIAVKNKDITYTTDNVRKVAMQLQSAGIGYA